MLSYRKPLIMLALAALLVLPGLAPRARAMDPVTMAVLAPVAIKAAQIATPYVMRGLQCGAVHGFKIGYDIVDILRLPLGLLQASLGAPLGYFRVGLSNICLGGMAPLKLVWDIATWPIALTGVSTGRI